MKIVKLEASNFKRLRAVSIEPKGAIVELRGKNRAGKTSCMDAIAAAIGGERLCPAEPIRAGEGEAVIRVTLDEYPEFGRVIAERRWTRRADGVVGSTLRLCRAEDGLPLNKPQKRLDEFDFMAALGFDPLSFTREPPKKQAEIVRELAGVDTTPIEVRRENAYAKRTDVNRALVQAKALLAQSPDEPGVPDKEVSAADLLEEQNRRQAARDANEEKRRELRRAGDDFTAARDDLARAQAEVERLKIVLAEAERAVVDASATVEQVRAAGKALKAEVEALQDPDLTEVPTQLRQIEDTNRKVRANRERATLAAKIATLQAEADALTAEVEKADAEKAALIAQAKLPVEGLSFTAEGVTLNGLPFEQASGAEQLRTSLAMSIALNAKLKVMLIRDASLLDDDSMALVTQMAEEHGCQVWLEVVATEAEGGILIVDGAVAEPAAKVEAA